ncbi:hypothetical protein NPIL_364591 [Nephila pilipes]|uniref:Uncharacterized protein n=1 Tax=Nephila pilipes TaxID=299642 RepID=A0A8X6P5F3_NEPPI|nr:hypothetical protein NPIL_364591 [Nephila pilipes]
MFTYKKNANKNTNLPSPRSPNSDCINNPLPPIADGINYTSTASNITIHLPTIKTTNFCGEIEEFHSLGEHFENCIDKNERLSLIDKLVFVGGYLDGEAK